MTAMLILKGFKRKNNPKLKMIMNFSMFKNL
jgi:hypothetical protein